MLDSTSLQTHSRPHAGLQFAIWPLFAVFCACSSPAPVEPTPCPVGSVALNGSCVANAADAGALDSSTDSAAALDACGANGCGVAPSITRIALSTAPNVAIATASTGSKLLIVGTGLGTAAVNFGSVRAALAAAGSATRLEVVIPEAALGATTLHVSNSGGNATAPFVVVAAPDISLSGKILGNPSKMPQLNAATGDGGAGINAFDMSLTRCTGAPAVVRNWQHNLDLADYRANAALEFIEMATAQTLALKFTTPSVLPLGSFATEENTNALTPGTMLGISSKPCDFDTAKLQPATRDACYGFVAAVANSLVYEVSSSPPVPSACRLKPNTAYYLNIRYLKTVAGGYADGCPANTRCGFTLGFK